MFVDCAIAHVRVIERWHMANRNKSSKKSPAKRRELCILGMLLTRKGGPHVNRTDKRRQQKESRQDQEY